MGAGHGHRLHYHGHSPVHRAPAHLKLARAGAFMLVVVATPREWCPAFAVYAAAPARRRRAQPGAARLPRQADGRRDAVRGVRAAGAVHRRRARGPRCSACRVSEPGPAGRRWALLVKGTPRRARLADPGRDHRARRTCCVGLRAAADARPDRADHGLHAPLPRRGHRRAGPDDRRRCARAAATRARRGTGRCWPARSGALFIRSYERGERVHLAMLSRGYDGTLPDRRDGSTAHPERTLH